MSKLWHLGCQNIPCEICQFFLLISHFKHKCGRTVTEYINFVVNTQTGQLDIEGKALGPH